MQQRGVILGGWDAPKDNVYARFYKQETHRESPGMLHRLFLPVRLWTARSLGPVAVSVGAAMRVAGQHLERA